MHRVWLRVGGAARSIAEALSKGVLQAGSEAEADRIDRVLHRREGLDADRRLGLLDDNAAFGLTSDMTLEAWVRVPAAQSANARFFSNANADYSKGFAFGLAGASATPLNLRDADGADFNCNPLSLKFTFFYRMDLYSEQPIPAGEWVQVVAVVSGDDPARLYINGEPVRAGTQPGAEYQRWRNVVEAFASDQAPIINGHPLPINPLERVAGDLDELVIYDRALSDAVVRELYRQGVAGAGEEAVP